MPSYTADEYRLRRMAELDSAARAGDLPAALLARWERALEDVSRWRFVATPIHGDLAAEHVLVDRGGARGPLHARVSGLIDWGEACVADPADDLAWVVLSADAGAFDTVLEAYAMGRREQPDRHLLDRARLAGELALVRWLNAGLAAGDDAASSTRPQQAMRDLAERLAARRTAGRADLATAACCGSRRATCSPAAAATGGLRPRGTGSQRRRAGRGCRCAAGDRPPAAALRRALTSWPTWSRRSRPAGEPWTGHFLPTLLGTPGTDPRPGDRRRRPTLAPATPAYGIALRDPAAGARLALAAAGRRSGAGCRCSCRRRGAGWCRCSCPTSRGPRWPRSSRPSSARSP